METNKTRAVAREQKDAGRACRVWGCIGRMAVFVEKHHRKRNVAAAEQNIVGGRSLKI